MVGAHTEGRVGFGRALLRIGVGREEKRLRAAERIREAA